MVGFLLLDADPAVETAGTLMSRCSLRFAQDASSLGGIAVAVHQITARRDRTVNYSKEARSSGYWARRGMACGLAKFNCSEATLQTCQDMISRREDVLLQAVSGLLGGVVCRGSSCGVVSGGALGLALMHEDELLENGLESEVGLISLVGGYAKWFERSYGTTLCKERVGVDF